MADFGMKVAREGKNINSTNPKDYLIWSKYPNYEVFMEGQGMIEIPAGDFHYDMVIQHNLGYVPQIIVYVSRELHDTGDSSGTRFRVYGKSEVTDLTGNPEDVSFVVLDAHDGAGHVAFNEWNLKFYKWNVGDPQPAYYYYKYYLFKNAF